MAIAETKDLGTLQKEWEISGGKIVYNGPWEGGQLRIYSVPSGYTAQYFFSLATRPVYVVSVDLERVNDETLVRYLIKGRDVAREIVKSVP